MLPHGVTMDSEPNNGITLTREMVSAGLGVLGLDPFSQAHVFTTATLNELSLSDVDAIREFPHVQVSLPREEIEVESRGLTCS